MENIANSPLLTKINQLLIELKDNENGIRISIARLPMEQKNSEGEIDLIKCLCWNVINKSGEDITEPELAIVHPDLNDKIILKDLINLFPGRKCIVDNEIFLDD